VIAEQNCSHHEPCTEGPKHENSGSGLDPNPPDQPSQITGVGQESSIAGNDLQDFLKTIEHRHDIA
jgi:hypothetical protein